MKKIFFVLLAVVGFSMFVSAQTKTIFVIPSTAKIYVNGAEVGSGTYTYKFKRSEDFIMLKFENAGYITRETRLLRENPNKSVSFSMSEDEAEKNSIGGGGEGSDSANKWFDINVKKGMSEDDAWKRLMSITTKYFDDIEIRDKSAGWIKTAWKKTYFTDQIVRTKMEVKTMFGDEGELKYQVRLSSQIAYKDCGQTDQCFVKYDRILRTFETIIQELQRSVGSNN